MSIFGLTGPKFVYDHGGAGEVTVNLSRAVVTEMRPAETYNEHLSELDLDRQFLHVATHWQVSIRVNFGKYASALAMYQQLASYKGSLVSLWLHSDGQPFMKTVSKDALFLFRDITAFYLTDNYQHDGVLLEFESVDPILQVTSYDASILVFDVAPNYTGGTFYLPVRPTTDDYFLLPLALDGSYITVTARTRDTFTLSPAMDGGPVRCLFVDSSINDSSDYIRTGVFTANAVEPLAVTFASALAADTYFLLCLADDGQGVVSSSHLVSGFSVQADLSGCSGWYLAVALATPDTGSTSIRVDAVDVGGATEDIVFSGEMPNDDYMTIVLDQDDSEYFPVSLETTTGFRVTKTGSSDSIIYAVFGREAFVAP